MPKKSINRVNLPNFSKKGKMPNLQGGNDLIAEIVNSQTWQIDLPIWKVTIPALRPTGGTLMTLLQES